jgi:hypothetical protein
MGTHPTPKVSDTERMLIDRSKRYEEPLPPLLVSIAGTVVQLPNEIALNLIRRRKATAIADPTVVPNLIIDEDDIDESLEAQLMSAEIAA